MFNTEFNELLETPCWEGHFIGYGNPDADILIVGQEVALEENSALWEATYKPNWGQWKDVLKNETKSLKGERTYPEYFSPLRPFYKQEFNRRKTSDTYYWYQVLINQFYNHEDNHILGRQCKVIDFFKHAFITELNEQTRINHSVKLPVRTNIQNRFDLMRATKPFWSRFKVVVFACGHYADALKNDPQLYSDIFGEAKPVYCGQLSGNYAKAWVEKIAREIKSILTL